MYRRYQLGELQKTKKGYEYSSEISNEQILKKEYLLTDSEYSLWDSYKKVSDKLFKEFQEILTNCKREDIMREAGIISIDSDWIRLVKLSKLTFFTPGFYVQSIDK